MKKINDLPLIYSCSGCSNNAQLANRAAVDLDRAQIAEMSCIVGVGGGVKSLVGKAQSGRPIIALDGCPLHCVENCLALHGIEPTLHHTLTKYGLRKRYKTDFSRSDLSAVKKKVIQDVEKLMSAY